MPAVGGDAPALLLRLHARRALAHGDRVTFEVVCGHQVLIKSGPENRCRSARGTSQVASLEFPPETGLILRCARKAG